MTEHPVPHTPSGRPHVVRLPVGGGALFVCHGAALAPLAPLVDIGELGTTELSVLDAVASRYPALADPGVTLALALALRGPRSGHVGAMLHRSWARLRHRAHTPSDPAGDVQPAERDGLTPAQRAALRALLPDSPEGWVTAVRGHPWVAEGAVVARRLGGPVGAQAHYDAPFVWQRVADAGAPAATAGILMTRRMWQQQARLAAAIGAMVASPPGFVVADAAREEWLNRLYPDETATEARAAAEAVATGRLSVVTGGPGTGKTWGLKRVLALLLEASVAAGRALTVALAAPTGKAAVRMGEALAEDLDDLERCGVSAQVRESLRTLEPRTLHKLLGVTRHAPQRFVHGHDNPLAEDLVVVDEASMVDVVMMRHLVEAMAPGSRLVLLGDRDQLASVEAGTVLADLVSGVFDTSRRARHPALSARIARLSRSHRFEKAASIACVAEGMQQRGAEDRADAVALMCKRPPTRELWRARIERDPRETVDGTERISWLDRPGPAGAPDIDRGARVAQQLAAPYLDAEVDDLRHGGVEGAAALPGFVHVLTTARASAELRGSRAFHRQLLDALGRYRVLCAHRGGPRGVSGLNQSLADAVRAQLRHAWGRIPSRGEHWLGRPLLITENSYDVDLRNGDVGLVVEGADGRLTAAFPVGATEVRHVALARLPTHDTALAMTVHKSQGSQFDRVALVLPAETGSPLLTRELVYTGLTRAKWRVDWVGSEAVLAEAVGRDVQRASGLAELLWG